MLVFIGGYKRLVPPALVTNKTYIKGLILHGHYHDCIGLSNSINLWVDYLNYKNHLNLGGFYSL